MTVPVHVYKAYIKAGLADTSTSNHEKVFSDA